MENQQFEKRNEDRGKFIAVLNQMIDELKKLEVNAQYARLHFNHTKLYHDKSWEFYAAMKKGKTLEECMAVFNDIPKPTNSAEQDAMNEQRKYHGDWYERKNPRKYPEE